MGGGTTRVKWWAVNGIGGGEGAGVMGERWTGVVVQG